MLTRGKAHRARRVVMVWIVAGLLAGALPGAVGAGPGGTGELTLSAAAVEQLVAPATERSLPFRFPGVGEVRLDVGKAREVRLLEGAVEVSVPVTVRPGGMAGGLVVELVPEIDAERGALRLRSSRTRGEGALAGLPDLSQALPAVALPRALEQVIEGGSGQPFRLNVYLQGIDIDPKRMKLEFMVKTGPLDKGGGS